MNTAQTAKGPWGSKLALFLCSALASSLALSAGTRAGEGAADRPPKKVSVVFHWKAQAQWAGFYMAKEKGFYAKRGLDVTLRPRFGRSDSLDSLMDGRVDFATHFLTGGIGFRGMDQPIVHVGQIFNRSNLMVVARKSAGVAKIPDLSGKPVAFWDGYYRFIFRAFFRQQGAADLIERPMGLTVEQFTSKRVAACSAMEYNEYNLIRTSPGIQEDDLIVFRLRDFRLDIPEDALYTTAAYAKENPGVCRDLLAATLEGWEYANSHPDETVALVTKLIADDPDELVNADHSRWMLKICGESVFPAADSPRKAGVLSREDFTATRDFLKENRQLAKDISYEDFVASLAP